MLNIFNCCSTRVTESAHEQSRLLPDPDQLPHQVAQPQTSDQQLDQQLAIREILHQAAQYYPFPPITLHHTDH